MRREGTGARIVNFGSERDRRKEPYAERPSVSDFECLQEGSMALKIGSS